MHQNDDLGFQKFGVEIFLELRYFLIYKNDFVINNKDRIAQMILMPVHKMDMEEVEILPETLRGKGGFGSTGK